MIGSLGIMNFFSWLTFSLFYNGPLFGLALFWLYLRVRQKNGKRLLLVILDILVVVIAISRYFGLAIPPSGHALFLTYSLMTVKNWFYRMMAAIMLILTIGLKVSWRDYTSWVYGMLVGLSCGMIWIYTARYTDRLAQPNAESSDK